MTRKTSFADRTAEHLINTDGVGYGDERERNIALEAQSLGMQLAVILSWMGALLLALVGQIGAPIALLVAPLMPGLGVMWYSKRRGVDSYLLMSRAPLPHTLGRTAVYGLILFLTIAALTYRTYFGEGLLDINIQIEVVGADLQRAMASFALLGTGLGVLVALGWMWLLIWSRRRRDRDERTRAEADTDV